MAFSLPVLPLPHLLGSDLGVFDDLFVGQDRVARMNLDPRGLVSGDTRDELRNGTWHRENMRKEMSSMTE